MNKPIIITVLATVGVLASIQHVSGFGEGFDCTETDSVPCVDPTGPYTGRCPNGNQMSVASTAGNDIDKCAGYGPGNGSCSNEGQVTCNWTHIVVDCYGTSKTYPASAPAIPTECKW